MKQVLQSYRTGEIELAEVPVPAVRPGWVLVRAARSVISAGTERSKVELARMSLWQKARQRPDQVRQVWQTVKREGLVAAARKTLARLNTPVPLGYAVSGTVVDAGEGVTDLRPGDRAACAGAGYASHAEYILVPRNLCARVPEGVSDEAAAFATLGAIALQGVRQAGVAVGERAVVIGLGVLGQLTVQLLRAAGCRSFGLDVESWKVDWARARGLDAGAPRAAADLEDVIQRFTGGLGADAVLITAATASSDPVELAARVARDRARIVAVGAVRLLAPRTEFYEKELSLVLSRSYGPGRYDPAYEEGGVDYPAGYVRWTEGRNLEAFLDLVAQGRVKPEGIVTHRFPFAEAAQAYRLLGSPGDAKVLGIVLEYPAFQGDQNQGGGKPRPYASPVGADLQVLRTTSRATQEVLSVVGPPAIGLIGAGRFAQSVLIPALQKAGGRVSVVATAGGATAAVVSRRLGARAVSASEEVLQDPSVSAVLIATRHDSHAALADAALRAGKAVFVEKPVGLGPEEFRRVDRAVAETGGRIMVGFNRRFAPLFEHLREEVAGRGVPFVAEYRVNAGPLPRGHWLLDPAQGGGRILGEVCHFVDALRALAGAACREVSAAPLPVPGGGPPQSVVATLTFEDGSVGVIRYLAVGDPRGDKERLELSTGARTFVLEEFKRLSIRGAGRDRTLRRWSADKGHEREMAAFRDLAAGGPPPVPWAEILEAHWITWAIQESARLGRPVRPAEAQTA